MLGRIQTAAVTIIATLSLLLLTVFVIKSSIRSIQKTAVQEQLRQADSASVVHQSQIDSVNAVTAALHKEIELLSSSLSPRIDSVIRYVPKWRDSIVYITTPTSPDSSPSGSDSTPVNVGAMCLALARDCDKLRVANDSLRGADSVRKVNERKEAQRQSLRDVHFRDSVVSIRHSGVSKKTTLLTDLISLMIGYGLGRRDR